jgi:hypothetical protein
MRTFQVKPTNPGRHAHLLWAVVAVAEDGTEVLISTHTNMHEADAAKQTLERSEMDNRR